MRLAVAAALGSLALAAPGDRATATFQGGTLTLNLQYFMTCGQPGAGPVAVTLPTAVRGASLRATENGRAAPLSRSGTTVRVALPRPPQVTCMSIAMGTLRVTVAGLHAAAGSYTLRAEVNRHAFSTIVRVP